MSSTLMHPWRIAQIVYQTFNPWRIAQMIYQT